MVLVRILNLCLDTYNKIIRKWCMKLLTFPQSIHNHFSAQVDVEFLQKHLHLQVDVGSNTIRHPSAFMNFQRKKIIKKIIMEKRNLSKTISISGFLFTTFPSSTTTLSETLVFGQGICVRTGENYKIGHAFTHKHWFFSSSLAGHASKKLK